MAVPGKVKVPMLGSTPLDQEVAPPPPGVDAPWEEAEKKAAEATPLVGMSPGPHDPRMVPPREDDDEDEAPFVVPDLPQRGAKRRKIDMYVPTKQAARVDALCRYAKFHFDVNKGETQELILKYGLNNEAEVMRALRAMVEDQ